MKGIWDIVLHMAVWNENIIQRMESGDPVRPAEGAWPALPTVLDEAAWEEARRRLWDSLASLQSYIESNPPATLQKGSWVLPDLLCRFIHNAYHIGQITKMRECRDAQGPTA